MKNQFDNETIYCSKLGHNLSFKYCRLENTDLPCSKIVNCWFKKISIENFVENNYTDDEKKIAFKPSTPKVTSIISLIEKAKKY